MAGKTNKEKNLIAGLKQAEGKIAGLEMNRDNAIENAKQLSEEIRQLTPLINEKDQQLARRKDTITSLHKQFNTQAGEVNELRMRLKSSWDKDTAKEVIETFLREMPLGK